MKWKAFELHTHTIHSDGDFKVAELIENSKKYMYEGIGLTDHNTESGHSEFEKNTNENNIIGTKLPKILLLNISITINNKTCTNLVI